MFDNSADSSGPNWYEGLTEGIAAGEFEVTMDDLEQLAHHDLPNTMATLQARLSWTAYDRRMWVKTVGGGSSPYGDGPSFSEARLSRQQFGPTPEGESLSGQVVAAREVYVETIRGMVADLERFRGNLLDSIRRAKEADLSAEDAMRRLARHQADEYRMDAAQRRAVESHRNHLTPSMGAADVSAVSDYAADAAAESASDNASDLPSSVADDEAPEAPSDAATPQPPDAGTSVPSPAPAAGRAGETFEPPVTDR